MRTRPTTQPVVPPSPASRRPGTPFTLVLAKRMADSRAPLAATRLPGLAIGGVARGAVEAARGTLAVRSTHHANVKVREEVRGEGLTLDRERFMERMESLERQQLGGVSGLRARTPEPAGGQPLPQQQGGPSDTRGEHQVDGRIEGAQQRVSGPAESTGGTAEAPPADRSVELSNLVARIELFVRAQRPALALQLEGLGSVELERRGPGTVAVTLHASQPEMTGLLDRAELERALQARGLRLAELRVTERTEQR